MSPHRYQVILEVALTTEQRDAYAKDRKGNPGARLYTIGPEEIVLSHLFTPPDGSTAHLLHVRHRSRPFREANRTQRSRSTECPGQDCPRRARPQIRSAGEPTGCTGVSAVWPRQGALPGACHLRAAGFRPRPAGSIPERRAERCRPEQGCPNCRARQEKCRDTAATVRPAGGGNAARRLRPACQGAD